MKKAITVFKKFRGYFLASFLVALAFLAVGLGTLGSVYSAGDAFELEEVKRQEDSNRPAVIFDLPKTYPGKEGTLYLTDVYLNAAIIYAEAGTSAEISLQRSPSSTSDVNKATWYDSSSYRYDGVLENFFTPEPVLDEEGNPVEGYKAPTATDVFYRFVAPFDLKTSSTQKYSTSSYRYWGLTLKGDANVLLNEVVFIGEVDGEPVVIPGVNVVWAAYGNEETLSDALVRAQALVDAQPSEVPSLTPTGYSRFTPAETATLMTVSEMRRGNMFATNEDRENLASVDEYHGENVYGALGTDFIALGAAIFGMSPFGVRFMPLLAAFGTLIVLSRFAARLFRSEKAGFVLSLLFATAGATLSLAHVGTPLMIGIFFFVCALDLVHRFYAKGMKKASILSALPILGAGLCGAAAICVNGAFVIPLVGVAVLFVFGLIRMKKAHDYALEKIAEEPETAPVPAPVADGEEDAPLPETREHRAAKAIAEYRFKRMAAPLLFAAGLVVGALLLSLIGMLPAYYAYLKLYDDPASPTLNVFALAWRTFANGFTGVNAYSGDTTWNFFYTLLRSDASFAAPAGESSFVLGYCINPIAILAAVAGIVYFVVRLVLLLKEKADPKTLRIALRRTLIPLCGMCLCIIAAACVKTGLVFVILAWLFAFVLAAGMFGEAVGKKPVGVKVLSIAGVVLLAGVFGVLLPFTLGIPLPANLLATFFG